MALGLWRHPEDHSHDFIDVDHSVRLEKLLEAPLAVVSAMVAAMKSIGIGVTLSTTYESPSHLARRLSTAGHLFKGSYPDSAARNMGFKKQLEDDERYAQAEEYVKLVYKLLESPWRDDSVVADLKRGVYTEPDRVRAINHEGKLFNVRGPHICQPSPQRTTLILQAGTSRSGTLLGAQHAEAIFLSSYAPHVCAINIAEIWELASSDFGRDGRNVKFLALATPIREKTEGKAKAKLTEYRKYASLEGALALFCGWTGIDLSEYGDDEELRHVESNAAIAEHVSIGWNGLVFVGTGVQVADAFQTWVFEADVDGFNLAYALFPQSFKDIDDLLLPDLRSRENFYAKKGQKVPLDEHIASRYPWKAGIDAKGHIIPE
ncbi:dibenzothiophene desulfurization enzyme A [Phaeosphaeria sp. MPI-PUGE-AT-0046c]|nr:dibenzothiophene desulfurization enzyme A [Phaeosphaeria sp. MPI-PUGE-AT-0046c]